MKNIPIKKALGLIAAIIVATPFLKARATTYIPNVVYLYHFDSPTSTMYLDSSGNHYDWYDVSGAGQSTTTAKFGEATWFNGGYAISTTGTAPFGGGHDITISQWLCLISQPTAGSAGVVSSYHDGATGVNYSLESYRTAGGSLHLYTARGVVGGTGSIAIDVAGQIATCDGTSSGFSHYVMTYNYSTGDLKGYLDGSLIGTANSTSVDGSDVGQNGFILNTTYGVPYTGNTVIDESVLTDTVNTDLITLDDTVCATPGCAPAPAVPASISWVWPKDGTDTPIFGSWALSFNANTSTIHYYAIAVDWGTTSSTLVHNDFWPYPASSYIAGYGTAGSLDIPVYVYKHLSGSPSNNGTYYAQAILYIMDNNDQVVTAYTPTISFTIDRTLTSIPVNDITSATDTQSIADANNVILKILAAVVPPYNETIFGASSTATTTENTLCNFVATSSEWTNRLLQGLFCPTSLATEFVQNSFDGLQNSFPFSVFQEINSAAQIAASATSTTSTLSVTNAEFGTIILAGPNTISDYLGTDLKNLIFEIEDNAAWAFVGISIMLFIWGQFHKNRGTKKK